MQKTDHRTEADGQEVRAAWRLVLISVPVALSATLAVGAGSVMAAVTALWPYVFVRQHLLHAASGSLLASTFFATAAVLGFSLFPFDSESALKRSRLGVTCLVVCWFAGVWLLVSALYAIAPISRDCAFKNERWCMVKVKDVEVEWSANLTP